MVAKRLQYRYDAVGNKVGMTDADGGLFTYTYDVMRRLTGVINPLGERTTYTYDLNGRRTSAQLSNGTRTSYSYDQGSRVHQIHTLKSNNSTVAKFDYAYDNNGRRTSVLEADGSRVTWTYDGTSQVTSEWRTGTSPFRHTFVYDTRGNRTLKNEDGARTTLVYDAANQLSSSADVGGTTSYTYDANGNQHLTVAPGGLRTTQIWDYENRLVKTLQPGGGVFTMAYDADGLRVRKETPSETKLFVWDDQNYLAQADDSGVTEVAYTTEPSTYGSTISHRSGGATTTYHFDALAAARALTNASETVMESYNYTAFGTILGSPSLLTPFLWGGLVGYYWDADLATQYIRARHYQPSIARWISLDPIGFAGGDANLFRYVGNSPTSGSTGSRFVLRQGTSYLYLSGLRSPYSHHDLFSDPSGLCSTLTCGPEVSEYFQPVLDHIIQLRKSLPVGSVRHHNFWSTLKFENAGIPKGSEGECADTVTLCGVCISVTELGNLAFGAAAVHGMVEKGGVVVNLERDAETTIGTMLWGGFYANSSGGGSRGFSSVAEVATALQGYGFWSDSHGAKENFCDSLKSAPNLPPLSKILQRTRFANLQAQAAGRGDALATWDASMIGKSLGGWERTVTRAYGEVAYGRSLLINNIPECPASTTEGSGRWPWPDENGKVIWK
ncbi:MAG: RHS repeat-associated core domain-containing protein [Planctomycetaceae bacterium]